MLAIHDGERGFHPRWVAYCERAGIPYRLVSCYAGDIVEQVSGCRALLWHHSHSDPRDILIARAVLSSLEHAGIRVFPNWRTAWHFDDKVAQKYLFDALGLPTVPTYVFVEKDRAIRWARSAAFPKVFKLRHGAGSSAVWLANDCAHALRLIDRAFGNGFPIYGAWRNLRERVRRLRRGQASAWDVIKGLARVLAPPGFAKVLGRERGYVYFQDFVPNNDGDTRVIVIGDRAFGLRRRVRRGDFRASGSGLFDYSRSAVDERCVELAFQAARALGGDCVALDFVHDLKGRPMLLEVSYGFTVEVYDPCEGYWNEGLTWHPGTVDPCAWMVDRILAPRQ